MLFPWALFPQRVRLILVIRGAKKATPSPLPTFPLSLARELAFIVTVSSYCSAFRESSYEIYE